MSPCSVSLVALAPSGMEILTARGRVHLKRLSADTGTEMHVIPAASVVRIRARGRDDEAVAEAKRALLGFVGGHRAEVFLDLARVASDASPPAQRSSSGGGGGSEAKSGAAALEEVGSGGGGGVSRDGGVGAGAAAAKKAAGVPVSLVSNKIIRRTVKLHGCEAEFVAAPPPPPPPVSSNATSGGRSGGNGNGNGNRRGGNGAGAEKHRHAPHKSGPSRQDAGGHGARGRATTTANDTHDGGSLSAVTGVSYASSAPAGGVQPRGVMIRGPPGLVDKARDALVALVSGRGDGEVVLGEEAAVALGASSWRKIQVRGECVVSEGLSLWSLFFQG